MNDMSKNKHVYFCVSDISGVARREARCHRVANLVSAKGGFAKARQAWTECGCAARSIGLNSMRLRQTRRRPKIAAAFCEPNSPHCRGRNTIGLPRRLRSVSVVTRGAAPRLEKKRG